MYDLFMDLEDLSQDVLEELENEKQNGVKSMFIPCEETLDLEDGYYDISESGYLDILKNELMTKIEQLSSVSITEFVQFFGLFGDIVNAYFDGEGVSLKIQNSDGSESYMASLPLADISFFAKNNGELEVHPILKDFATDEMILFAKFYVNFKNTFVSGSYSILDAYLLYAGMGLSEPISLK